MEQTWFHIPVKALYDLSFINSPVNRIFSIGKDSNKLLCRFLLHKKTDNSNKTKCEKKYVFRRLRFDRLLTKTVRKIKMPWKSFSKVCRSMSTLNCRSRHTWIKLIHTLRMVLEAGL